MVEALRADSNLPDPPFSCVLEEWNLESENLELANLVNFITGDPNYVGGRCTLDLKENVRNKQNTS